MLALARWRSFDSLPVYGAIFLCIATFVLAHLTWRYIEIPLRYRLKVHKPVLFIGSACLLLMFFASGTAVQYLWKEKSYRPLAYVEAVKSKLAMLGIPQYQLYNRALQIDSWEPLRARTKQQSYGGTQNEEDLDLWFEESELRKNLLIVGNSHSKDIYNVLSSSKRILSNYQLARFGVQIRDIEEAFYSSANYRNADIVVLASLYSRSDIDEIESKVKRILSDEKKVIIFEKILGFSKHMKVRYTLADEIILDQVSGSTGRADLVEAVNEAYTNWFAENRQRPSY